MKYLVSYSGGKDSTATLLFMYEKFNPQDIAVVFCDTGWETKLTYGYINYIENWCVKKGISFYRLVPPMQFEELCLYKKMFPRFTRRYCTENLKLLPFFNFLQKLKTQIKEECVVLVGERAGESHVRSKKPIIEFSKYHQTLLIRPIFNWTTEQVFEIHKKHNVKNNPMYNLGFTRVGCAPCIFANKNDIRLLIKHFPEQIEKVKRLEKKISDMREGDSQSTFFYTYKLGKNKVATIDKVIEWAMKD